LVWRLATEAGKAAVRSDDQPEEPKALLLSSNQRPILRHAGRARAMEIDLSREPDDAPASHVRRRVN